MKEIEKCPFRIYTEVRPAIMQGHRDVTVTDFMPCLKAKCPAWYVKDERIPCTNQYITNVEYCKRLEQK